MTAQTKVETRITDNYSREAVEGGGDTKKGRGSTQEPKNKFSRPDEIE
jgi:hypothetical protein